MTLNKSLLGFRNCDDLKSYLNLFITFSHQRANRYPTPVAYSSELKSSCEVTIAPQQGKSCVQNPNLIPNPHNLKICDVNAKYEQNVDINHFPNVPSKMDFCARESTSIESNVDTLDSGFSSDRFHTLQNHQPILPGEQVKFSVTG